MANAIINGEKVHPTVDFAVHTSEESLNNTCHTEGGDLKKKVKHCRLPKAKKSHFASRNKGRLLPSVVVPFAATTWDLHDQVQTEFVQVTACEGCLVEEHTVPLLKLRSNFKLNVSLLRNPMLTRNCCQQFSVII